MRAPTSQGKVRLDRWRHVIGYGDNAMFIRRVAADGLDDASAADLLTATRLPDAPMPRWLALLDEVCEDALHCTDIDWFSKQEQPTPYQELLAPFVRVASRAVNADSGERVTHLTADAFATLESALLQRLLTIAGRVLQLEFDLFRRPHENRLRGKGDALYRAFVDSTRMALPTLFLEYSTLARLMMTAITQWIGAVGEFLVAVSNDRDALQDFGASGRITSIEPFCSDPHLGGRGVMIAKFESGTRVVYKPRNDSATVALAGLFAWLEHRSAPGAHRVPKTLDRGDHSWAEYVEAESISTDEELTQYAFHSGTLICIVHLLQGADFHSENLVATRKCPVLIDNEGLLSPRFQYFNWDGIADMTEDAAAIFLAGCVLRSGLLPLYQVGMLGVAYNAGGLNGEEFRGDTYQRLVWPRPNTDDMELVVESAAHSTDGVNLPVLDGNYVNLALHLDAIVSGFDQMYRFLLEHRDELFGHGSPLTQFSATVGRFIFRNTSLYTGLLERSFAPNLLREGVDRSIELDVIVRAALLHAQGDHFWPLVVAERTALENLDIPCFRTSASRPDIQLDESNWLLNSLREPSISNALDRFRQWDANDLKRQSALIRISLVHDDLGSDPHAIGSSVSTSPASRWLSAKRGSLLEGARDIGRRLLDVAIDDGNDGLTWVSHGTGIGGRENRNIQLVDDGFFMGATGIATLFAALAQVGGDPAFASAARAALAPIRRRIGWARIDAAVESAKVGAGSGLAAVAYGFLACGKLLQDPELIDHACTLARAISDRHISRDREFDLLNGTAGALSVLISCFEETGDLRLLDRAEACASHLLENRAIFDGFAVWPLVNGHPICGFAHGVSGISASLGRLCRHSSNPDRLGTAVQEALAWESLCFSQRHANWVRTPFKADRSVADDEIRNTWCYGASGIGISRLLLAASGFSTDTDVRVALAACDTGELNHWDHPCCGNLGRAEFLLSAGLRSGDAVLVDRARQIAISVHERARSSGGYSVLLREAGDVFQPGFFQGMAGIGYFLLRIEQQSLPQLIAFDYK